MKLFLFFFLLLSLNAIAQVRLPTNEAGQVQYQETIKLPDNTRKARQIIEQARSWANLQYDSTTAEQQYDAEHTILFIRSFFPINKQSIRYTLTIEAKYGRYRATLTDLVAENDALTLPVQASSGTVAEMERAAGSKPINKKILEQTARQQAELYRQIDKACRDTLASLKQALTTSQTSE
jgi:hypothetical protein